MSTNASRLIFFGLGLILILCAVAYYWLFVDNRMPAGRFNLDMSAVRQAAAAIPGAAPTAIEVETVSHTMVPHIAMVAGTDWSRIDTPRNAYRVLFPASTLSIDTGWDAATARSEKVDSFDAAAYVRVARAMRDAAIIVVTYEHADHLGGLLTSPDYRELLHKALITREQFDSPRVRPLVWPGDSRTWVHALDFGKYHAVAPGVVLIKAPGHTPGSQLIYVRLANGREYLFVGDVASEAEHIQLQRSRSRLVDDFIIGSDRHAVLLQIAALHRLQEAEPAIILVPGHDAIAVARFEQARLLTRGFHQP